MLTFVSFLYKKILTHTLPFTTSSTCLIVHNHFYEIPLSPALLLILCCCLTILLCSRKAGFSTKTMTLKGGSSQACAACKYQRRRCTSECVLAPYFPSDHGEIFKNAHKLFGVRNIVRILKKLDPGQKSEAMKSIIYQANIRERFPVHGCLGIIWQLHYQLRQYEEELQAVLSQLSLYKLQELNETSVSQLQLGMAQPTANAPPLNLFQQDPGAAPQQLINPVAAFPVSYPNGVTENGNGIYNPASYIDPKDNANAINAFWAQQAYNNGNNENNIPMAMQPQFVASQPLIVQDETTADYDEIQPFFDTIDDRQSYINSKEAYESRYNIFYECQVSVFCTYKGKPESQLEVPYYKT